MRSISVTLAVVVLGVLLAGCTTRMGTFSEASHYVYPNSNVTPVGPAQASKGKWSILIPPRLSAEEAMGVMDEAIAQQPDADLLIDYTTETRLTSILGWFWTLNLSMEGTAASMEVGKQTLH